MVGFLQYRVINILRLCDTERGFSIETRGLNTVVDSPPDYGTEDREDQLGEPRGRSRNVVNRREIRIGRRQAADARDSDNSEVRYLFTF